MWIYVKKPVTAEATDPGQEVVGEHCYRCSGKQTSDQTDCNYAVFRPADKLCSQSWRKMILWQRVTGYAEVCSWPSAEIRGCWVLSPKEDIYHSSSKPKKTNERRSRNIVRGRGEEGGPWNAGSWERPGRDSHEHTGTVAAQDLYPEKTWSRRETGWEEGGREWGSGGWDERLAGPWMWPLSPCMKVTKSLRKGASMVSLDRCGAFTLQRKIELWGAWGRMNHMGGCGSVQIPSPPSPEPYFPCKLEIIIIFVDRSQVMHSSVWHILRMFAP